MGAWQITRKDLIILRRDLRALAILVVMPIIFIAILGFSTGRLMGWKAENELLQLAVVNEDGGELAGELVNTLEDREGVELQRVDSRREARERVDEGDRVAAVFIGAEFQQRADQLQLSDVLDTRRGKLAGGAKSMDVEVYPAAAQTMTSAIVEQLVFGEALRTLVPHVARRNPIVQPFVPSEAQPQDTGATEPEEESQAVEAVSGFGSRVYQVLVPSYTVMFTFFLINIMARSFIAERDVGTLLRLRAAPVSPVALVAGKTVPFFIISLGQGVLLFLFGKLLFGMSWGPNPPMLLPVLAATSLAATTLGLLTATLVRSDAQVSAYANLVVITLAGISGCFMPRDWLPELMRDVSLGTPHAWSLIAYHQLLATTEPNLLKVWQSCGILVAFSAVFFSMGWLRFRSNG